MSSSENKSIFRPQVTAKRSQALSGRVILRTHVPSFILTLLLLCAAGLAAAILLLTEVQTDAGSLSLLSWLTGA